MKLLLLVILSKVRQMAGAKYNIAMDVSFKASCHRVYGKAKAL